jgi:hypothetical protein
MSSRNPPENVRERWQRTKREPDGTISVGNNPIAEYAEQVDWDNLSPAEEYILAILDENDMLE